MFSFLSPRAKRLLAAVLAVVILVGCSDDGEDPDAGSTSSTTALARPEGPAADVSEVLEGGEGVFLGSAAPPELADGFIEQERVAAGTATSYRSDGELPADGTFDLVEDEEAEYRTRIVVRRPEQPEDFNGTVVIEWLNVSAGLDANPDFTFTEPELYRGGYAWVGVSAQMIGIEGGPVLVTVAAGEGIAGVGLRTLFPERYGSLRHPGDAFAYDIYTQVARAVRSGDGMGELRPERVLAIGESQSAFALTTYANGVQPLTGAFDGILIHSRTAPAMSLGEPGAGVDIAGSIAGTPTRIRTDLDVPVLTVQTESDVLTVLNSHLARQDDSDRFRLWEIAGTAHADRSLLGDIADTLECGGPINAGPQRFVVRAALRALDRWVRDDELPPTAERLELDATPAYRRDADGIVLGGIRTPHVDVPVDVLSGEARPSDQLICILLGSTTPIAPARLAERYESAAEYLSAYEEAADETIAAGFVLEEDRDELLADAQPDRIEG
jgi:hypothetical protein